jgi:hypothetical protein
MGMAGVDLAAFIRKQNQLGELIAWTVVLRMNAKTAPNSRRNFGGHKIGLLSRTPARQTIADYALKNSNIQSPGDEAIDLCDFMLTPTLAATLAAKVGWTETERDWLLNQSSASCTLEQIARELAEQRASNDSLSTSKSEGADGKSGSIVRLLRPKTHGLLLIYPLVQPDKLPEKKRNGVTVAVEESTNMDPEGPPSVGLAISFPASESATRVEYQVTKRWDRSLQEDWSDVD